MKKKDNSSTRAISGGLAIASGLASLWQGLMPMSMPPTGGMGGMVAASPIRFLLPSEPNLILGLVVVVTGIIVLVGRLHRPWPGVLMIVYGSLMLTRSLGMPLQ